MMRTQVHPLPVQPLALPIAWKEKLPALAIIDTLVGGEHMEKAGNRISFFDYGEALCHAFLLGLLARAQRYDVKSNRESGTERPDVLAIDNEKSRCALFELKVAQDFPDMEAKALEALAQADARAYGDDLAGFTVTVYWLSSWYKKVFVRVPWGLLLC